jgi:hypothetical protein
MRHLVCVGIIAGLTLSGTSILACPIKPASTHTIVTGKSHTLAFETTPTPVEVGKTFSVSLKICDENGKAFSGTIKTSATMPRHKHGMNYLPSVEALGDGKFNLDGFLFHMPGHWQFVFDLRDTDKPDRITIKHLLQQ